MFLLFSLNVLQKVKGLSFHSSLHSENVKGGTSSETRRCSFMSSNALHLKKKKKKGDTKSKGNVFASKVMRVLGRTV